MITIQLSGTNKDEVLKASFVLSQLFEGISEETSQESDNQVNITLKTQHLPDNNRLLALLKTAEWRRTQDEILSLHEQPIVSRERLQRLREGIEAGASLACDFEDMELHISKQVSEALEEIERIEGAAVGYILNAAHPAMKSENTSI